MRVFVDALLPCQPTSKWRWPEACHLLSDDLDALTLFAYRLRLRDNWLQWSRSGTPHFDLTPNMRTRALLMGAIEISNHEAGLIVQFWRRRYAAALARLSCPPPYKPNPF